MVKWGMVIDLDKCVACQACTLACKAENNVPYSPPSKAEERGIFWTVVIPGHTRGEYPLLVREYFPLPCMHCENPPCVKVCPVGATYKREDGIVMQNAERCIGCRYCMVACPYGRRYFNWSQPWKDKEHTYKNPDVPIRPNGVVEKCTFCVHRVDKGLPLPACNQACPGRARFFGDLDDSESHVTKLVHSPRAIKLLEELGTEPKVCYLLTVRSPKVRSPR